MKATQLAVIGALALGACAQNGFSPAGTATMPLNGAGGPALSQGDAIGITGWALNDPANTAGHPDVAARAIAAEDWLAGQTLLYGNFGDFAPANEPSWAEFRAQVRAAIGVPADAPSQDVVTRLLAVSDALAAGNTEAARAQLAPPVFTLGPDQTLRALASLPSFPARAWAFAELRRNANRGGGGPGH